MNKQEKVLEASCQFCGKKVFSLYEAQLRYNAGAHELSCPQRLKKTKGEPNPSKQGRASNSIKEVKKNA